MLAEGNRISTLTQVKGIKQNTILCWSREAARDAEELEAVLLKDFRIKRAQWDGLWPYVDNKGEKTIQK